MGLSGNRYVFNMYADDGTTRTIYIGADGNAVFSGEVQGGKITSGTTIDVTTDLHVGNNIYLGDIEDTSSPKMIVFNERSLIKSDNGLIIDINSPGLRWNGEIVLTMYDYNTLNSKISDLDSRVTALEQGGSGA